MGNPIPASPAQAPDRESGAGQAVGRPPPPPTLLQEREGGRRQNDSCSRQSKEEGKGKEVTRVEKPDAALATAQADRGEDTVLRDGPPPGEGLAAMQRATGSGGR